MIAVDTNILVYAHRADSPFHQAAAARLAGLASSELPWALPWPCLHEFFAIVTHPKIYSPPTPVAACLSQIDAWLEAPSLVLLSESTGHWPTLRALVRAARVVGPQVHDARIAALCVQHAVSELWTADRDFSRFPQIKTTNPLVQT